METHVSESAALYINSSSCTGTWHLSVKPLDIILEDLVVVATYKNANGERHGPESRHRPHMVVFTDRIAS